jgi:hypothetical protein
MILAAGEVPDQPRNRVGFRIWAVRGDLISRTVGEVDHELSYPAECVHQNPLRMLSHITEPYRLWLASALGPRRPQDTVTVIDGGDPLFSGLWISRCQVSHAQPLK